MTRTSDSYSGRDTINQAVSCSCHDSRACKCLSPAIWMSRMGLEAHKDCCVSYYPSNKLHYYYAPVVPRNHLSTLAKEITGRARPSLALSIIPVRRSRLISPPSTTPGPDSPSHLPDTLVLFYNTKTSDRPAQPLPRIPRPSFSSLHSPPSNLQTSPTQTRADSTPDFSSHGRTHPDERVPRTIQGEMDKYRGY